MKTGMKWISRMAFAAAVAGAVMVSGPRSAAANDCNYDRPQRTVYVSAAG